VGSTTATLEQLSVRTDAATKIDIKGHQRIVDGLFILAEGLKTSTFRGSSCAAFSDSIPCWLANSEIRWQDGNNNPKFIPNLMDKRCSQHRDRSARFQCEGQAGESFVDILGNPSPGYLSHPPGFLNVKRAKVVTIMGYYAVLSLSFTNLGTA
jgi:hypothetical protein